MRKLLRGVRITPVPYMDHESKTVNVEIVELTFRGDEAPFLRVSIMKDSAFVETLAPDGGRVASELYGIKPFTEPRHMGPSRSSVAWPTEGGDKK